MCATLRTDAECGLAVGNAAGWFAACGPNVLAATPPVPNCRRILAQFESPLALLHVATADVVPGAGVNDASGRS